MKQASPYIGITGFMSQREVLAALTVLDLAKYYQRKLMVGVLVSWKTTHCLKEKWPNRYPVAEKISEIFVNHPKALNLAHYRAGGFLSLDWQLEDVAKICGPNLHGFQLNIPWPETIGLKIYRERYPDKIIVLQIGSRAFEIIGYSPERLAKKVAQDYKGLIDYILLDPSGSYGMDFDPAEIAEYLGALKKARLEIGIGVAGGLSATTLRNISPLIAEFSGLSIDAEDGLRDSDDHLDLREAGEYISKALEMFSK